MPTPPGRIALQVKSTTMDQGLRKNVEDFAWRTTLCLARGVDQVEKGECYEIRNSVCGVRRSRKRPCRRFAHGYRRQRQWQHTPTELGSVKQPRRKVSSGMRSEAYACSASCLLPVVFVANTHFVQLTGGIG
jgi:hypothetical protein